MADDNGSPEVKLNGSAPPSAAGEAPRRRGRPPGSGKKPTLGETPIGGEAPRGPGRKKPHVEIDREAMARKFRGSHYLLGMAFGLPELFLSEKEADEMAEAFIGFAREYDFEPDPKVMAAIELAATAGFIYVPKVGKIIARLKDTKRKQGQTIDGEATPVEAASGSAPTH